MDKDISPYLYIGDRCNNNCIYCSEADEDFGEIKPKSFKQITKEILEARRKYEFINFMGKEPTLRNDLVKILKFAKQQNFKQIGFTTNGRMLAYDTFAREVVRTGVDQIAISFNGCEKRIHDMQSQVGGSFDQTMAGIKNVMRLKRPEASFLINLPLNKLNYFLLKPTIELLLGLGVKEINILFVAPLSRRSKNKRIVMKMSELGEHAFKTIKPYLKTTNLKFLLVEFLPCSLSKEARQYFFPCLEKNTDKIRIPLCRNCLYQKRCDGVLKSYIDLYGTKEFKL